MNICDNMEDKIKQDLSIFNDDQREVYNSLVSAVLFKDGKRQILLNAAGGCGKTFVLNKLLETIAEKYKDQDEKKENKYSVMVLAPTHKAKSVIKNSFRIKKNKVVSFATVASFLGYTEDIDENGEKVVVYNFNPSNKANLVIIDECSMISSKQLELLNNINSIVIYSGDECQLNPVGEKISPVFSKKFDLKLTLTKNERADNKNVLEVIKDFRKNVYENRMSRASLTSEFQTDSKLVFKKNIYEAFENNEDSVVLTWTNSKASEYNNDIRERLFLKEGKTLDKYYKGECVTFNKYVNLDNCRFYTSTRVKLISVVNKDFYIKVPSCICKKLSDFGQIEKKIIESEEDTNFKYKYYDSDLSDNETKKAKKKYKYEDKQMVLEHEPNDDSPISKCSKCHTQSSRTEYKKVNLWRLEVLQDLYLYKFNSETDRSIVFNTLYKYRDRAKALKNKDLWAEYYNNLDILNAPLDYIYSLTIHKAQGSGYDRCFIDMTNVLYCKDESLKTRLAYTAVSRTSNKILIYKGS